MAAYLKSTCALELQGSNGGLATHIFETLAVSGRLRLPQLVMRSRLPTDYVNYGLSILIQQGLVLHYNAQPWAPTFYSVDWRKVYNIVRLGRIAELVESRYGEGPGIIMADLSAHGHVAVGQTMERFAEAERKGTSGAINTETSLKEGDKHLTNGDSVSSGVADRFYESMRTLLVSGFVVQTYQDHFKSVNDLNDEIEEKALEEVQLREGPGVNLNTPKNKEKTRAAILSLQRERQNARAYADPESILGTSRGSIKRSGSALESRKKRVKGDQGLTHGTEVEESAGYEVKSLGLRGPSQHDAVIHIDLVKCTIALRSQRLESFARRALGQDTSAVYHALLRVLDGKISSMGNEEALSNSDDDSNFSGPSASPFDIEKALDPDVYLSSDPDEDDMPNGVDGHGGDHHSSNSLANGRNGTNGEQDGSTDQRNGTQPRRHVSKHERIEQIKHHLDLLSEHSWQFCKRSQSIGSPVFTIDFGALTKQLICSEIDNVVQARFGRTGLRVVRMLRTVGKMEEKSMSERCFIGMKTLRAICTQLMAARLIEVQEIPKDNSRQPTRTIYLYSFDLECSRDSVLQSTYKALVRAVQRLQVEKEEHQSAVQKVENSWVTGQKVTKHDREGYQKWKNHEIKLMTQIGRLDDSIAVLRDFDGKDRSLDL